MHILIQQRAVHIPNVRQEQVDVVDIGHLPYKGRYSLDECIPVVLDKHVQVDAMLSAGGERFPVVATVNLLLASTNRLVDRRRYSRIDILLHDLHD